MSRYGVLLLASGLIPFILSFWPELRFWRHYRPLLLSIFFILLVFGGWDIFATWRGHWSFDPSGVCGLRVANLPLEEFLFFIVVPFCCIFTWEAINFLARKR